MQRLWQHCAHHLLVWVALSVILGAAGAWLLGERCDHALLQLITTPLMAAVVGFVILLPPARRPLLALPFFVLVGLLHTHNALQPPAAADHLFHHIAEKTRATVVGTIVEMPEFNGSATRLLLECESLLPQRIPRPTTFLPVQGRLQLTVQDRLPPTLTAGSRVMAIASIERIQRYQTPGTFDYRLHMAAKDIFCSAWVESAQAIELVTDAAAATTLSSRIATLRFVPEQIRQHTAAFTEEQFPREVAGEVAPEIWTSR